MCRKKFEGQLIIVLFVSSESFDSFFDCFDVEQGQGEGLLNVTAGGTCCQSIGPHWPCEWLLRNMGGLLDCSF